MADPLQQFNELVCGNMLGIREFRVEIRQEGVMVRVAIGAYMRNSVALATLVFDGVIGLKFEPTFEGFPLGLQIVPDTSGWANVAYKITDPEYHTLSFWSANFRIEISG